MRNERKEEAWSRHVKESGLTGAGRGTMINCREAFDAGYAAALVEREDCVLQAWVKALGLRHQGTLLTAVRGCDTAPKDDPSKLFIRCYRAAILNAHCGDAKKAATFMQHVDPNELRQRFDAFRKSCDHYPHHYLMHVLHAIEIVGYKHPDILVRAIWHDFYSRLVYALHLNVETEVELDGRLNADEATFAARDFTCDGIPVVVGDGVLSAG